MLTRFFCSRIFNLLTKWSFIVAIVTIIAMLGFGFPKHYNPYVNLFFATILFLGIIKTVVKFFYIKDKIIARVLIFDLLSVLFITYYPLCILITK